ncbi:MAG: hypothetical protein Q7S33_01470 [Nanoarchaeota archaeon]|nr:hypothetical protein [Nanoarchaeota archaeon]
MIINNPRAESRNWTEEVRVLNNLEEYVLLEDIFTQMLIETVPQSYKSETKVLALCVGGAGCAKEGTMLKKFYKKRFQLTPEDVWVASTDIRETREIRDPTMKINQGYDFELNGLAGDARLSIPYLYTLEIFNEQFKKERTGIGHIHYNYPNPRQWEGLIAMLSESDENLSPGGIISVITSDFMFNDLPGINYLRDCIAEHSKYQVTPFYRFELENNPEQGIFGIFTALKINSENLKCQ